VTGSLAGPPTAHALVSDFPCCSLSLGAPRRMVVMAPWKATVRRLSTVASNWAQWRGHLSAYAWRESGLHLAGARWNGLGYPSAGNGTPVAEWHR
jgi:hypothetical protein